MANPRIFISSTCYDLAEERDGLSEFCDTFGFDTTLSERGDVFYHPDLHTHLSCVRETSNCQMFVLVIGGRFGGKYKVDPTKSITNAEYAAAIENGSPTFAFVKQEVLNDHNVWQRNKELPFAKSIIYPSIEKQEYAEEIFKFIDVVRSAPVNNGIFGFRLTRDIYSVLRKQWAGMMFEYLQSRSISKQLKITNDALGNLSIVSTKIEELVKSIYRNIDAVGSVDVIRNIDNESAAEEFLLSLSKFLDDTGYLNRARYNEDEPMPSTWWEFLEWAGWNTLSVSEEDGEKKVVLLNVIDEEVLTVIGNIAENEIVTVRDFESGYRKLCSLPKEVRTKLISKYFYSPQPPVAHSQRRSKKSN